jgi:predicted ABC-type transport system involved in lysophospholipase L1 biosynthesis ATPase subunit
MTRAGLITLEDVRLAFDRGRIVALDGVSLGIGGDQSLALVGRSGSGKSCLLNVATGLDVPSHGRVLWDGREVSGRREWAELRRTAIGIVFQEFHLLPTLTTMQNVELALMGAGASPGEQRRRATEALERVGLGARLRQLPGELSGGERQRVAIARALVREPRILFADEPSAETVCSLLFDLHAERRMGLVLVTHDHALAARCERLVRLADGRIVADEPLQREAAA